MNSSLFAWSKQVAHFSRIPQYSVLVFDNRGAGNSSTPRGPYRFVRSKVDFELKSDCSLSTSGMAQDAITLLDYVGWTEARSIHVVGLSLGGMISQGTLAVDKTAIALMQMYRARNQDSGAYHIPNTWCHLCRWLLLDKFSDRKHQLSSKFYG